MASASSPESDPADRLEREAPGYLDRVRRSTDRLGLRPGEPGAGPAAAVRRAAMIDVEPPASGSPPVGALKRVVSRLLGWYLRYLGNQVTVLGRAMADLGDALVERTDDLRGDVDRLAERVDRLERRDGAGG